MNLQGLPTETAEKEEINDNKLLVILLSTISGVFGALLVAFMVVYLLRTRSYKRQIKILTDSNFGSNSDEINKNIKTLPNLPNTNIFANEQSNPGFKNILKSAKDLDRQSIISSESDDFAGIYDNPIFNISNKVDSESVPKNPFGQSFGSKENDDSSYI